MNVTVATFHEERYAVPLKKRLVHAGLRAEVESEAHQQDWFHKSWMSHAAANVKIQVPAEQAVSARELLLRWDAEEDALAHAVRCPRCGGSRVQYPQHGRKNLIPAVVSLVVSGFKNKYYCQECHHVWPGTHDKLGGL